MTPTPQDLAQLVNQTRLSALQWMEATIPGATLVLLALACAAVVWLCWSEVAAGNGHRGTLALKK